MQIYFENTHIPLISPKETFKNENQKVTFKHNYMSSRKNFKQCRVYKVTLGEVSSQPIPTNYLHHRNNGCQSLVDIIHILSTIRKHAFNIHAQA